MKKIVIMILIVTLMVGLVGCSEVVEQISQSVENLKLEDKRKCKDLEIKFMDSKYNSSGSYYVTPSGFEMDKLDERGYYMEIVVTYSVHYKKDYDVLWDIGYAGSPKYEVSIVNSDGMGNFESSLNTKTSKMTRSISVRSSVVDFKNQRWVLTFSTDNVQNIIYFTDIVINYRCFK